MSIFSTILNELGLSEAYEQARDRYVGNTAEAIESLLYDPQVPEALVTSLEKPMEFAATTDHLYAYLNENLETITGADAVLELMMEADMWSANEFVPRFVHSMLKDGVQIAQVEGVSLSFSIYSAGSSDTEETVSPPETLEEIASYEPAEWNEVGVILLRDDGSITMVRFEGVDQRVLPVMGVAEDLVTPTPEVKFTKDEVPHE